MPSIFSCRLRTYILSCPEIHETSQWHFIPTYACVHKLHGYHTKSIYSNHLSRNYLHDAYYAYKSSLRCPELQPVLKITVIRLYSNWYAVQSMWNEILPGLQKPYMYLHWVGGIHVVFPVRLKDSVVVLIDTERDLALERWELCATIDIPVVPALL